MARRKGTVMDLLFVSVVLVTTLLIILGGRAALDSLVANIDSDKIDTYALEKGQEAYSLFDAGFVLIAICGGLAVVVSSAYIDTSPLFFGASVIAEALIIFVGSKLSNIINRVITGSAMFGEAANHFPLSITLMRNLPIFLLVLGFAVMVVLYGKSKGGMWGGGV